ncbi:MAG: hypothetical protein C5B49_06590 [Bdellovibrio sp.]|nr:MAG: hypothetical protein C5B49_06590 [Bdellovibrio sp.]
MYRRAIRLPSQSFFLFGARGTGKTTLLKDKFHEAHFIDLLNEQKYQSYLADIDLFRREVEARPLRQKIVVDEVQRIPALLNFVHDLIERQKRQFILTGSSARKLRSRGVNLLAGRALERHLYPLLPSEMSGDFDLSRALSIGTLPIVVSSPSPQETLEAYTLTYLKEEIKAEAIVKNLAGFARFLPVAALFHGQVINISNVASESGVSRTTVQGFLEILVDTLVGSFLPAYVSRPKIREVRHPKFYLFDPGVVRAIKKQSGPVDDDEKGFLFEGFVYHCLRAYGEYGKLFDDLNFWSPLDVKSLEVDFIARRNRELFAIEAKAKKRIKSDDLKGLKAATQLKGMKSKVIVYLGDERQSLGDGMLALPFREFVDRLSAGQFPID